MNKQSNNEHSHKESLEAINKYIEEQEKEIARMEAAQANTDERDGLLASLYLLELLLVITYFSLSETYYQALYVFALGYIGHFNYQVNKRRFAKVTITGVALGLLLRKVVWG